MSFCFTVLFYHIIGIILEVGFIYSFINQIYIATISSEGTLSSIQKSMDGGPFKKDCHVIFFSYVILHYNLKLASYFT